MSAPAAGLRNTRERVIQTLAFELGGLLLVTPLFAWASGSQAGESLRLLVALSVVVMTWSALYNTLFDLAERRFAGRVASERPHRWRVLHALGLETTAVVVSTPVIVWLTPLGWIEALVADLALTAVYAVYAYAFHWVFDRLRPVAPPAEAPLQ